MTDYAPRSRAGAAVSLHLANGWYAVYWIAGILAVIFVVNMGVAVVVPGDTETQGAVIGFLVIFLYIGMVLAVTQMLPLALSLGLTRRTFYVTSAATYLCAGAVLTLLMAAFAVVESITNGWGVDLLLFDGLRALPLSTLARWVAFFTVLTASIFLGALSGAIYARWAVKGLWSATIALILLGGATVMAFAWQGGWSAFAELYDTLGLEALLIGGSLLVAALAGAGAHVVIRRTPF